MTQTSQSLLATKRVISAMTELWVLHTVTTWANWGIECKHNTKLSIGITIKGVCQSRQMRRRLITRKNVKHGNCVFNKMFKAVITKISWAKNKFYLYYFPIFKQTNLFILAHQSLPANSEVCISLQVKCLWTWARVMLLMVSRALL